MILQSKLNKFAYKTENPELYLIGDWWKNIDPVFAGRLAYAFKCAKTKGTSNRTFASTEEQTKLYNEYLNWKKTGVDKNDKL